MSRNATTLQTNGKDFADKEGGGGQKIPNSNVIYGSSLPDVCGSGILFLLMEGERERGNEATITHLPQE